MTMELLHLCCLFHILYICLAAPNIIFILTDDQDTFIGGMTPMVKTKKLLGQYGITFTNTFVDNPLCCPSRSSILTGKYTHNGQASNNSISGDCNSETWQTTWETQAFAPALHKAEYKTFFAGKYLNQYGKENAGGVEHVPPGWHEWHGLVGNSQYYNYTLSNNGRKEIHGDDYEKDYLPKLIGDRAAKFITSNKHNPFFMMLSTPSCHAPFTPAPQYKGNFSKKTAPRTKSFNTHAKDKHWLIQQAKTPISKKTIDAIDEMSRNRWRTLLSVDDMVENIVKQLESYKILDNTYIVYSSDNGYHLGQFSLPNDKRQIYEFDIRVPLLIRGPGIIPNISRAEPIHNIDFAPTFLDMAGIAVPSSMDGLSLKPLFNTTIAYVSTWRTDLLIEHTGESSTQIPGCPELTGQLVSNCEFDCVCEDAVNNTYSCVRTISESLNLIYCQFSDTASTVEVYNLTGDPDELVNIASTIDPNILVKQNQRLIQLSGCDGESCRIPASAMNRNEYIEKLSWNPFYGIKGKDLLWFLFHMLNWIVSSFNRLSEIVIECFQ